MDEFLIQATVFLAAAVIAVPLAKRLGLGSVLGYLLGGVVVGQVSGFLGVRPEEIVEFAEFGVVLLLFVIGLELEPRALWELRHKLVGLGGLQIALTTFVIAAACGALGIQWQTAVAIGLAFALSSTAMVLQTLSEKGLTQTNGGRSALSVLLTQDIAVIPILIVVPFLAVHGTGGTTPETAVPVQHGDGAHFTHQFVEHLPAWGIAGFMLGSVAFIMIAGQYLIRPLFRAIATAGLMEVSTAATLLLVVSTALLMEMVGLSAALGTFLAGVVLASSEFRHEMQSNIEPFKGLLLGLFFLMVGAGMDFGVLVDDLLVIVAATLGLILIKFGVLFLLAVLFDIRGRDRWLFTLGLAQAGEFGLVLVSFMGQTRVISQDLSDTLPLVVALSMILTPALFIGYEYLSGFLGDSTDRNADPDVLEHGPIIIAGVGRFGQVVNDLVRSNGFRTTVLDHDIKVIRMMRRFGVNAYLGDPARPELLEAAGLAEAEILVIAIDDPVKAGLIAKYARRRRPDMFIVSRARDRTHVFDLHKAEVNAIVRETFDSALRAGRYVLQRMGMPEEEAHVRTRDFFRFDRNSTRELAQTWDPSIPAEENEAYVNMVRRINREIDIGVLNTDSVPPMIGTESTLTDFWMPDHEDENVDFNEANRTSPSGDNDAAVASEPTQETRPPDSRNEPRDRQDHDRDSGPDDSSNDTNVNVKSEEEDPRPPMSR